MEDVLDLYAEPYGADRPWCALTRLSTPPEADRPTSGLRVSPRWHPQHLPVLRTAGWRHVDITHRLTMSDFACQMQWVVDVAYPDAPVIRVILDNLKIHRRPPFTRPFHRRDSSHRETPRVSPVPQTRQLAQSCPEVAEGMEKIEFSVLTGTACRDAAAMKWHWLEQSTPMRSDATPPQPPSTGVSAP